MYHKVNLNEKCKRAWYIVMYKRIFLPFNFLQFLKKIKQTIGKFDGGRLLYKLALVLREVVGGVTV